MKGEHFSLESPPHLRGAQKLRDQRQIEPLAGVGRSAGDLCEQLVPQGTKIGSAERQRRQSGESDPIGAQRLGRCDPPIEIRLHVKSPQMTNDTQRCRSMALNAWMDSRRIRRRPCRRGKLRGDIAVKDRWPDMIEAALEIGPDFSADIGPALAERKILAEIGPTLRFDHALEQGKTVRASCERVEGMFAEELQGCVGWMLAHSFEHVAPDHQEAGAGVTDAGKVVDG